MESFAPFLLQGTDLVTLVLERAGPHLQRTADPAHTWLRARIGEVAAELDRAAVPGAAQRPSRP